MTKLPMFPKVIFIDEMDQLCSCELKQIYNQFIMESS